MKMLSVQTHFTSSCASLDTNIQKQNELAHIFIYAYTFIVSMVRVITTLSETRLFYWYILLVRSYCTHSLVDCTNTLRQSVLTLRLRSPVELLVVAAEKQHLVISSG